MERRTKRIFLGCASGCLLLILISVGSCVAFQSWLRAPGELLEPERMLGGGDALGYLEGRLELDNPGTAALAETVSELMRKEPSGLERVPLLRLLYQWNQGRNVRELYRVFPANLAWAVYPAGEQTSESSAIRTENGRTESVFALSVQRASHQFQLADWIMSLVFRGREEATAEGGLSSFRYRGETIVRIAEEDIADEDIADEESAGGRAAVFVFVRKEGLFIATGITAAKRAVDRLTNALTETSPESSFEALEMRAEAAAVEQLYSQLPTQFQFRGAFSNTRGELPQMLPADLGERPDDVSSLRSALEGAERVTVLGGFLADGQLRLEFHLFGDAAAMKPAVDSLLRRTRGELNANEAETSDSDSPWRGVAAAWQSEAVETDDGIRIVLFIPDVRPVLEQGLDAILRGDDEETLPEPPPPANLPIRRD